MTERFYIIDLQDVREGDLARVGRKALHLGLMMRAGFPVPRGFVIPTDACEEAIRSSGEQIELDEPLRAAIIAAYRARGFQRVAVRSSATLEDLRHASFAGIYTTRINVASDAELIQAVVECIRSLQAPPTALYRQQVGLEENGCGPGMAVVVQEMVDAEVSGVIYTLNPVTFSRDECVINSVFGLGEPLVSGRVPGDTFRVNREGRVLEARIGEHGTTLTPAQLRDLVDAGKALEAFFRPPSGYRVCHRRAAEAHLADQAHLGHERLAWTQGCTVSADGDRAAAPSDRRVETKRDAHLRRGGL